MKKLLWVIMLGILVIQPVLAADAMSTTLIARVNGMVCASWRAQSVSR